MWHRQWLRRLSNEYNLPLSHFESLTPSALIAEMAHVIANSIEQRVQQIEAIDNVHERGRALRNHEGDDPTWVDTLIVTMYRKRRATRTATATETLKRANA